MLIPVKWLREFVDVAGGAEVKELLLKAGFEAEILSSREKFKGVVAAQVLKATPIPGTHLKSCLVSDGKELCSVICGAPNVEKGQFVAFAQVGAELPGGIKITKRKIHDSMSCGMIVSEKELGIGSDSSGIMVLKEESPLGTPISFQKDEIVEAEITPDRGDCLSILGIAREISLIAGRELKVPAMENIPDEGEASGFHVERISGGCLFYTGCLMNDVKIGPSPEWIKNKILSMGLNPQNNVVDITNMILFELGQPLHAFDADKIQSRTIKISDSSEGEKMTLLDGAERALKKGLCLIRDADKPIALGGVMGGGESGISNLTTSVFIESAYFEPGAVYKSSADVGVKSPSSMRFSRGVDPMMVKKALMRAVRLIKETASGRVKEFFQEGRVPGKNPITVQMEYVRSLLGVNISSADMEKALSCSGVIQANDGASIKILPHSWRNDLKIEEDMVEEAVRFIGYDGIPPRYPALRRLPYGLPDSVRDREKIINVFVSAGFSEVITPDMISEGRLFQNFPEVIKIKNPVSADMGALRPTLFVNLADVMRHNISRGIGDVKIFESGSVFRNNEGQYREEEMIAGMAEGLVGGLSHYKSNLADFFYVKGIIEEAAGRVSVRERINTPFLDKAVVFKDGDVSLFMLGEVSEQALNSFDIKKDFLAAPIIYFELYYKNIKQADKKYSTPPAVPSAARDISILIKEDVIYGDVEKKIFSCGAENLERAVLIDLYRGKPVEDGKKSMSFRLFFRGKETLIHSDIEPQVSKILKILAADFGASLREK
ncbi:phenylalanine--tRNA ligase subunit beta [bacterium]|nr:phenylalanine--tRNA ligase subunit beta [bacterium]MBU3955977.1 phenylalanine--tRNA ligase subunit beta [bacterium]